MGTKKKPQNVAPQPLPTQTQPTDLLSTASSRGITDSYFAAVMEDNEAKAIKYFPDHQKHEFAILKTIYGDAVTLDPDRKMSWVGPILAFTIRLQPLSTCEIYARFDIEFPPAYPKIPPEIRIIGIQPQSIVPKIKKLISTYPNEHLGQREVVPSMIDLVMTILDEAAAAEEEREEERKQGMSLEEERAVRDAAAREQAVSEEQLAFHHRQEVATAEEEQLAQDVEAVRRRHHLASTSNPNNNESEMESDQLQDHVMLFDQIMSYRDSEQAEDFKFRAVYGKTVILRRSDKVVTIVSPVKQGIVQEKRLLLKEIYLPEDVAPKTTIQQTMTEVEKLLEEAKDYDHPSIVKIFGYKLDQITMRGSPNVWTLSVLTEWAQGGSLNSVLEMAGEMSATKMRPYVRQLLDALEFFDRKGYVHPALHGDNILFFGSPAQGFRVKLSDGYGSSLWNLVEKARDKHATATQTFSNWMAPELNAGRSARTNLTCIWELGVVMLQMVLGVDLTETYTSPENTMSKVDFDETFEALLYKMCAPAPRHRATAFELQSHKFFRDRTASIFATSIGLAQSTPAPFHSRNVFQQSRWNSEWEPVGRVGRGGFGHVHKARNRMDGEFYAVKCLTCETSEDLDEIWKEVRMLAKLNHPGIVRYYNAWVEDEPVVDDTASSPVVNARSMRSAIGAPNDPSDDLFGLPSTGHDFMDPSMLQFRGPDYDESEDDDDNLFGYQSPPSVSDEDEESAGEQNAESADNDADSFGAPQAQDFNNESDPFGADPFARSQPITDTDSRVMNQSGYASSPLNQNQNPPRHLLRSQTQSFSQKSTLYIQMELCETGTLANLINDGLPRKIDNIWQIFRGILDGLQHIHEYGIVHRDLKPANIFIDHQQNPKIGDFGLAAPGRATTSENPTATLFAGPQSRGVGTKYYTAPELEIGGSGKYSSKADMFSLGIVFFEMCFPMSTLTERYDQLKMLNGSSYALPPWFEQEKYIVPGRIILELTSHDQNQRPSASELLKSADIPEPLEDERVTRYIDRLIQAKPEQYQEIVDRMFHREASKAQALAYNSRDENEMDNPDPFMVGSVNNKLEEIFHRHGAVASSRQTVFPAESFYSNAVKFVDPTGMVVQLPVDLTLPFARLIAFDKLSAPKSYCFGTVYRPRPSATEPVVIPEVDFDFVSYNAKDLSLKDAYVIKVLDDILQEFPTLSSRSWTIVVNHGDLLDLALRSCNIAKPQYSVVKRALSQLHVEGKAWKDVKNSLRSSALNIPNTSVSDLYRFNMVGSFEEIRKKLMAIFNGLKDDSFANRATRTLGRMAEVLQFIERLGVKTKIVFSPLSNNSEQLYRGSLMFQCVEGKAQKVLAVGGRYDELIRNYQTKAESNSVRAVGLRLNMLVLLGYMKLDRQTFKQKTNRGKDSAAHTLPSRVDVVITSFEEKTLKSDCLDVLRNFLSQDVKAEVSELYKNMEELDAAYGDVLNYWLVIVRPGGTLQRPVKVRSPGREETDVRASELVAYIKNELGDRQHSSALAEPKLKRTESSHGGAERAEVSVLTPVHKSKKINRSAIVDSADTASRELADSLGNTCPRIAVDTDDETLQLLRNTRLADEASWKALKQSVALVERKYLDLVQEELGKWAKEGREGAFVFNYKTKACIYYDFGKLA